MTSEGWSIEKSLRRVSAMKTRVSLGVAAAFLLIAGLSLYVGVPVARELTAARTVLSEATGDLNREDIADAKRHLIAANRRLAGAAPAVLRLLPVIRQNIAAVDGIVDAAIPAVTDAENVTKTLETLERQDLVVDGRVRLGLIEQLEEPLHDQTRSLSVLDETLQDHRSGWLLPPIWEEVTSMGARTDELRESAATVTSLVDIIGPMLGAEGRRRYLVLLVNNAELRGAGGILSAIGTLKAGEGSLQLGEFNYFGDLIDEPPRRVTAPADFEARFSRYFANTTEWVNVTASPDVPDVALVASRLYALATGIKTDGAIIIDPRGIAALVPADAEISAPLGFGTISRDDLPRFIYSDSYALIDDQTQRRRAVLHLGSAAFKQAVQGGLGDRRALADAGDAVEGQHIRVISFDRSEGQILEDAGVTGELTPTTNDSLLVTVQNLGGDKLDYWMRRSVSHACDVVSSDLARCSTEVELTNNAPRGLPHYVVQDKGGVYHGFIEVYVPSAAELTAVEINGDAAEFYKEQEESRTSIGMYFRTRREQPTTVAVSYDLPLDGPYALTVTPQPLPKDASLTVRISGLSGWRIEGPGQSAADGSSISYSGRLNATHSWLSVKDEQRGLSAMWSSLKRFWNEPLF